jgi:DNA-binding NarL/FixJ family response regulator
MPEGDDTRPVHRVLLVDDDAAFRLVMRTLLRRAADVELVGEADDGATAVALADEHRPDVVLLDLLMPGMDGFEALPRLVDVLPHARIVILTALEEREATREAVLVGASAFLEKRHVDRLLIPLVRGESPGEVAR